MKICVLSRTGRGGQYDPHVFHLGSHRHAVVAVLEQWTQAQYRFFNVRVQDGRRFVLRHDPTTGAWELAAAYGGGPGAPPWCRSSACRLPRALLPWLRPRAIRGPRSRPGGQAAGTL